MLYNSNRIDSKPKQQRKTEKKDKLAMELEYSAPEFYCMDCTSYQVAYVEKWGWKCPQCGNVDYAVKSEDMETFQHSPVDTWDSPTQKTVWGNRRGKDWLDSDFVDSDLLFQE